MRLLSWSPPSLNPRLLCHHPSLPPPAARVRPAWIEQEGPLHLVWGCRLPPLQHPVRLPLLLLHIQARLLRLRQRSSRSSTVPFQPDDKRRKPLCNLMPGSSIFVHSIYSHATLPSPPPCALVSTLAFLQSQLHLPLPTAIPSPSTMTLLTISFRKSEKRADILARSPASKSKTSSVLSKRHLSLS